MKYLMMLIPLLFIGCGDRNYISVPNADYIEMNKKCYKNNGVEKIEIRTFSIKETTVIRYTFIVFCKDGAVFTVEKERDKR